MNITKAFAEQFARDYGTFKRIGDARNDSRYINEVNYDGNKKLVNTPDVKYIIFNIPAVTTCPYSTEYCRKLCYALKAEIVYPNCRAYRYRAFEITKQADFTERMIFTIGVELIYSKRYKNAKQVRFRIHESGDFYNQEYTDKWLAIIKYFAPVKGLVFDAYTKSLPYFRNKGIKQYKNLALKASVWADTKPELKKESYDNYTVYTALTPEQLQEKKARHEKLFVCRCANCAGCSACVSNKHTEIACIIH